MLDKLRRIQEAHLLLTCEKDTLRRGHNTVNVKFDELEKKCSSMKRTLNAIREKCAALHWDKEELVQLHAIFLEMLDGESIIEEPQMRVTSEEEGLKSKYNELKARYKELETKYTSVAERLNVIREERESPQRNRDKLVGVDGRMNMILDEHLSVQNDHLLLNQERNDLRSKQGSECPYFWTRCNAPKQNLKIN
ncbi:hypothetical protein B7P43_G17684 [Cryptotermes secundus]|uniref:Uncharacterized protein n=2 Tax=Cryptotermes secundus TaxID=105785 RepID=A0A2J7QR41_9NEOP|nr:hypothetical protein B7P43_G17684 [Cryptotermes secundus]